MATFSATVDDWYKRTLRGLEILFKEAAQELVDQMQALVPVDTGFLRASLMASTTAMPQMSRSKGSIPGNLGEVVLVINSLKGDETLYLGYTANYAAFVHYGAQGRPARPWVNMVAQRWQAIVAAKAAIVKARLGI